MKLEIKIILGLIIMIPLVLLLTNQIMKTDPGFLPTGYYFCTEKGYDSTSMYGDYSEKFKKVECVSCYNSNCIYEEFNVTKKFGLIIEDKSMEIKR